MPDIQEVTGSHSDLTRSRSRSLVDGVSVPKDRDWLKYHRRYSNDTFRGNHTESQDGSRNYSDLGKGNYIEIAPDSPRTPASQSANNSKLSSAGPGDITSASSKDSGNYSYREQASLMESPGRKSEYRKSPSVTVQHVQEGQGHHSNNSSFDYSNQIRNFNRYDSSFREPPTVDIPTKYEDIAMFKSSEALDQVSSSTDSGYGQGHINQFDRVSEIQRFSGE